MQDRIEFVEVKDHYSLIDFYIERGIEMNEDNKYPVEPLLFSIKMLKNGDFIGASTVYKKDDDYVLDEIAIKSGEERKGYGGMLLKATLDKIQQIQPKDKKSVFIVAQKPNFFKKHGFYEIAREQAPDFSLCFTCPEYQKTCFPKVMVKIL